MAVRSHVSAGAGEDKDTALSVDEALDRVGTGRFQNLMLLVCGLGNAADAVELLCISLVLPAIGETNSQSEMALTLTQLGWLSSSVFWGALVGTLGWGCCSDALGRRAALTASMLIAGIFGFLSALSYSVSALVLCRSLAGVGVGGSVPVVFAFLCEARCCLHSKQTEQDPRQGY